MVGRTVSLGPVLITGGCLQTQKQLQISLTTDAQSGEGPSVEFNENQIKPRIRIYLRHQWARAGSTAGVNACQRTTKSTTGLSTLSNTPEISIGLGCHSIQKISAMRKPSWLIFHITWAISIPPSCTCTCRGVQCLPRVGKQPLMLVLAPGPPRSVPRCGWGMGCGGQSRSAAHS